MLVNKKDENLDKQKSANDCLKAILTVAELMGFFPFWHRRHSKDKKKFFVSTTLRFCYSALVSLSFLFCAVISLHKSLTVGIFINQLITPLFYLHSFFTTVLFVQFAEKWPRFMHKWCKIEDNILRNYPSSRNLYKQITYSAFIMTFISFTEHALAECNFIFSSTCENSSKGLEHLLKKQFHFVYAYVPYECFYGIVLMVLSWNATFAWTFGDMFIILISMIMTERYKQINGVIKVATQKINSGDDISHTSAFVKVSSKHYENQNKFWRQIREDYNNMNMVIRSLSKILANIVLLSYTFNLTFILIQLFNSLRHMSSIAEGIYFFFSFGFIIIRVIVVSIYGALIGEESQAGLPYLTSLPSEVYNDEVRRLITQIHIDTPGLTGHNFFRVTKGLVLSVIMRKYYVAAAIITYELVLIQFNQTTLNKYLTYNDTICF